MSDGSKQQHLYESLSALVDNEATELELHRILSESERDPSVRARWHRYQLARTALQGEVTSLKVDISDAVREAVMQLDISDGQASEFSDQEFSALGFSNKNSSNVDNTFDVAGSANGAEVTFGATTSGWRANIARFAIAASVASVVLISAQQFDLLGSNLSTPLVASSESVAPSFNAVSNSNATSETVETAPQNSPFAVVDLQNVSGTFNALSTPQQSRLPQNSMSYSPTQHQKQLQDERVRMYIQQLMLEHAENSAQHSGSGLMPYTRVPAEAQR